MVLECWTHDAQSNNYHCVLEGLSGYCEEAAHASNIGTESTEMRFSEGIIYGLGR